MKKIIFTNHSTKDMRLILEPWAEEYVLMPGVSVELVATGESENYLEMSYEERGVAVWGWTNGTVKVMRDGKELVQSPQV